MNSRVPSSKTQHSEIFLTKSEKIKKTNLSQTTIYCSREKSKSRISMSFDGYKKLSEDILHLNSSRM